MRGMIVPVAAGLIAIFLLTGCASAAQASAERLVPADSSFIAKIQVAQILKDVDFEALYREAPKDDDDPQSFDQLLMEAQEKTGIDFRQFSTVVLFGDASRIEEQEYFGVIAQGSFEEDKVIAAIQRDGETVLSPTEYKGQKIHLDVAEDMAFSVFGRDTLVLGSNDAVRAVIDVRKGAKALSSGKVYNTFKSQGDPMIRVALAVPAEAKEELSENLGGFPGGSSGSGGPSMGLPGLQDLNIIGLVIDKNKENLIARAQLDFSNDQSAKNVGDAIDGFLKLFGGLSADPKTKGLLEKMRVTTAGPRVTVVLEAPVSELKESIGSLWIVNDGLGFTPGQMK